MNIIIKKLIVRVLLLLMVLLPLGVTGHEGHGNVPGNNVLHYLELQHLVPMVVFVLIVVFIFKALLGKNIFRNRKDHA